MACPSIDVGGGGKWGLVTSVWRLSTTLLCCWVLYQAYRWDPGSALSPLSRGLTPWLGTWLGQVLSPRWCIVGCLQDLWWKDNGINLRVGFVPCLFLSFMTQKQSLPAKPMQKNEASALMSSLRSFVQEKRSSLPYQEIPSNATSINAKTTYCKLCSTQWHSS